MMLSCFLHDVKNAFTNKREKHQNIEHTCYTLEDTKNPQPKGSKSTTKCEIAYRAQSHSHKPHSSTVGELKNVYQINK